MESQISIDGKSVKGSRRCKQEAEHIVNAFCNKLNAVLSQESSARGGKEISSAMKIIDRLDLNKKVITGDAMFCQQNLCQEIVNKGGDYIFTVKDNQPNLLSDICRSFDDNEFKFPISKYSEDFNKAHGRIERRAIEIMKMPYEYQGGWSTIAQIARITRYRFIKGKESTEYAYLIISNENTKARNVLSYNRNHWFVENKLHWTKDYVFLEDRSTIVHRNSVYTNSFITSFAISLCKKVSSSVVKATEIMAFDIKKAIDLIA